MLVNLHNKSLIFIQGSSSSVILVSNSQRPGRFSDPYDSDPDSLMGYNMDFPAGSPVGFPIESPMDSLASSPETSPESSVMGSPVGSRATSPNRCPATTSATSLKRTYENIEDGKKTCFLTNTIVFYYFLFYFYFTYGTNPLIKWI